MLTRFAKDLVKVLGWVAVLHVDLQHQIDGLPSWVPDWTHIDPEPSDITVARYNGACCFEADADLEGEWQFGDDDTLHLHGIHFDDIKSISEPCHLEPTTRDQRALVSSRRDFANDDLQHLTSYVGGGDIQDAIHRTLLGDRFHEPGGPVQLEKHHVDQWLRHVNVIDEHLRKHIFSTLPLDPSMSPHIRVCLGRRISSHLKPISACVPMVALPAMDCSF